jgi:multimeric flavodoxin WrbA
MNHVQSPQAIKILGISGSPNPQEDGTSFFVQQALAAAEQVPGVETEFISLDEHSIEPCDACDTCKRYYEKKGIDHYYCKKKDDVVELVNKFVAADGHIIGSPVYFFERPGLMKDFMDRFYCIYHLPWQIKEYAVGGAIAVGDTPNCGQEIVLDAIETFYAGWGVLICGGSSGIGVAINNQGLGVEGAAQDKDSINKVRTLGREVAETTLIFKLGSRR